MSLQPQVVYVVPEDTAPVARAAIPKGNPYLRMHDELGRLYADRDFAALFPVLGRPALAPAQLALMALMQFAEHLTDRQAAEDVRADRLGAVRVPGTAGYCLYVRVSRWGRADSGTVCATTLEVELSLAPTATPGEQTGRERVEHSIQTCRCRRAVGYSGIPWRGGGMYLGVDTHKRNHVVVALDEDGHHLGTRTVPNTPSVRLWPFVTVQAA